MFNQLQRTMTDPEMPAFGRFICQCIYGWLLILVILPLAAYHLIRVFVTCVIFLGRVIFSNLSKLRKHS